MFQSLKTLCIGLYIFSLGCFFSSPSLSQISIIDKLNQHESSIQNVSLEWEVENTRAFSGNARATKNLKESMKSTAKSIIARHKITNQVEIDKIYKSANDSASRATSKIPSKSQWKLKVGKTKDWVRFSGTYIDPASKIPLTMLEYFGDDVTVLVKDKDINSPSWGTKILTVPGKQIYNYREQMYFPITTIDRVLLSSSNVLKIFGGGWKQVGENNGDPIFEKTHKIFPPTDTKITITLSKKYGYAPLRVIVYQIGGTITFNSKHFRKINNVWIVDKFESINKNSMDVVTYSWVLKDIQPEKSIRIELPIAAKLENVSDVRLVPLDMSIASLSLAFKDDHYHDVVSYQWNGTIPSIQELRELHRKQQLTKSLQLPSSPQHRILLLIIGVGLLALGLILKIRNRRSKKVKK